MGLTDMLKDDSTREQLQDFTQRYDKESARESFQRLDPEQRREAARSLGAGDTDDPNELARATNRARKEKPDMLEQLMGNPALKGAVAGIAANAVKKFR